MAVTEKLICSAVQQGVNYFDTAYIYPGSEAAIGEIFEKNNLRDKIHIATKLPHYLIKNREGLDKLFDEELRRLRTDYVDYYLMHMLNDADTWQRLLEMGIQEWIAEKKASALSVRWVSPIMVIQRCSASYWMPTTGISARCSTIIWMNIPRQAAGVLRMLTAREFR